MLFLIFILCVAQGADGVDVSIDPVTKNVVVDYDKTAFDVVVKKVVVCDAKIALTTTDQKQSCEANGFVRYESRHLNARHPHVESLTQDHYYAEVHMDVVNRNTGEITNEVCMLRVSAPSNPYIPFVVLIGVALVLSAMAIGIVSRKQPKRAKEHILIGSDRMRDIRFAATELKMYNKGYDP